MKTKHITLVVMAILLLQCRSDETRVEHFKNGSIKARINYNDGLKEGKAVLYYPNGKANAVHVYKNDLLDGTSQYYSEDGKLAKTVSYVQGVKQGPYKIFYKNGNIAEVGNTVDDTKRGKVFKYYENDSGKLHFEFYVLNFEGNQYEYYSKRYSLTGELQGISKSIDVEIKKDSVALLDLLEIQFKIENIKYDSGIVAIGAFDDSFHPFGKVDTIQLENNKGMFSFRPKEKGTQWIRGVWSVHHTEEDADSIYHYSTLGFFEEKIFVY